MSGGRAVLLPFPVLLFLVRFFLLTSHGMHSKGF
jgi:hypothetical protein